MSGEVFATTHRLRFNDTDRLGHVNNAVWLLSGSGVLACRGVTGGSDKLLM